jgi:site-specific recombinase XerD
MTTAFQRARRRAGVDGLRFHDLRHEGISRLFERGMQIQQVALVSGHRSWSMLKRYTNLKPESLHAHVEPSTSG